MLRRSGLIVAISFIVVLVFDVKQSWKRVPLPYLDGEYSKIFWIFFMLGVFCSRKQRFLSLFVCRGVKNSVSKSVVFRLALETAFLITFCLLGIGDYVSLSFLFAVK